MTTPLGKYKLVKLIASGGMAEVYLAKQAGAAGFEKLVCLKRILPHLARDKQFVDMFLNEARLAAQLDHPNIVSILDLGESNGNYFIAMEFIDGPNLRGVAKRATELNELLPIPEVLKILSMACSGLQYAHDLPDQDGNPLGLVHRDISPDNIMVHRNGSAKVVDFGIAKAANSGNQTRTGTLKGKVAYMPPEQLRGEALDRRTDVFALGVVLYELLAGKRPWEGASEVALIGKIMTEPPRPLGELRPDASAELLAIVERALMKNRNERYQSCHLLQADLEELLVHMGQTITPARISDFIKAYSPEPGGQTEGTDAALGAVADESFGGTGAAPRLLDRDASREARDDEPDEGTMMLPQALAPQHRSRGLLYGIAAFAFIAALGGAAGLFFLKGHADEAPGPVAVERATVGETAKPAFVVVTIPPQPPRVPRVEEPSRPRAALRRVAIAEPPPKAPAPVVIIKEKEAPRPAPVPAVTAKGELVLLIRPWARVEVDGREIGVTPLADPVILSAGDHVVRLVNPDLGKEVTRTVHITASDRVVLKEILDE